MLLAFGDGRLAVLAARRALASPLADPLVPLVAFEAALRVEDGVLLAEVLEAYPEMSDEIACDSRAKRILRERLLCQLKVMAS